MNRETSHQRNWLTTVGIHGLNSGQQSFGGCVLIDAGVVVVRRKHRGVIIHVLQHQADIRLAEPATPIGGPGDQAVRRDPLPVQQTQGFQLTCENK